MNMDAQVERLDHLGVIAGVIKDLCLVEFIDSRIPSDAREGISCGEAVAGMVINGLGFSDRPLTLTPQFFENKALSSLFRPGVNAENFNRFKLGRALDDCHAFWHLMYRIVLNTPSYLCNKSTHLLILGSCVTY